MLICNTLWRVFCMRLSLTLQSFVMVCQDFSLRLFVGRNADKIRLMSNIVVPQPSKISGSTLLIILGHFWSNSLFLKGLV